jgi:hypothetical protein
MVHWKAGAAHFQSFFSKEKGSESLGFNYSKSVASLFDSGEAEPATYHQGISK